MVATAIDWMPTTQINQVPFAPARARPAGPAGQKRRHAVAEQQPARPADGE